MIACIKALLWELAAKGRFYLAGTLGLTAVCSVWCHLVPATAAPNLYGMMVFLFVWTLFFTFAAFHHTEHNPQRQWHGFPYREFVLPVPTLLLVSVPMVAGLIAVEVIYFAWGVLVFPRLKGPFSAWPAIALGAGTLFWHAVVWGLAGYRFTRLMTLSIGAIILLSLGAAPFLIQADAAAMRRIMIWDVVQTSFLAMVAFSGAWFAVGLQRHGGGRGRNLVRRLWHRALDRLPRRTKDFSSATSAQFWYEWRRGGLALPVTVAFTLVLIFLPVSWDSRRSEESTTWILGWALFLPVILATIIGKTFATPDFFTGQMRTFVCTRPLSTGDLVAAKMKVAAVSALLSWAAVLIFVGTWLTGWSNIAGLREMWDGLGATRTPAGAIAILILGVAGLMLLTWRALVTDFWLGFSHRKWPSIAYVCFQVGCVALTIWWSVTTDFSARYLEQLVRCGTWLLSVLLVAKLWIAVFSWRLRGRMRTLRYVLAWGAGTAVFVVFVWLLMPRIPWARHIALLAALLIVPLARTGFAPTVLANTRHRA